MKVNHKKRAIAVVGPWLPVALEFLRSKACAELSPHGAKLLLDGLSMLGPNATKNGDVSFAPKIMEPRGWTSRSTLAAAVSELIEFGLLVKTRQGSRLDCSLFAITIYPLDCDIGKLDVKPGCYLTRDYGGIGGALAARPTETNPARWRRARKLKTVSPPWDEVSNKRPSTGQTRQVEKPKQATLSHHGTNPPVFHAVSVPPRVTYLDSPSGSSEQPSELRKRMLTIIEHRFTVGIQKTIMRHSHRWTH